MTTQAEVGNDVNVVALWTSVDLTRWISGCIAGVIAAALAMIVGGIIATTHGFEFIFPIKLLGTAILGNVATGYGSTAGLMAGLGVLAIMTVGWGFVFGHFVRTNSFIGLLGMGFTWGAFSWIFEWNLFLHSFKDIGACNVPSSAAFACCMAYGFGMMTIALVDKAIRR
jgi:hypothetical protein